MTRLRTPVGAALALILLLAGAFVAWLAIGTAAVQILPPETPVLAMLAPGNSQVTLDKAMMEFETHSGRVDPVNAVTAKRAALKAPLEAEPYLLAGVSDLVAKRNARALDTLEAGRRLDPRDRWINLLLLDRYLRLHRYDASVGEFALLARLVGAANGPIAEMLAQMAVDPATRGPVRETLARDPLLELSVLSALATSNAPANLVMSMASGKALAVAGAPNGWGAQLVSRLVEQKNFVIARQVWTRVYRVPQTQTDALIYDASLSGARGGRPFGWSLANGSIGGVSSQNRQLSIDYYGRDSGELAAQLLMLRPGRYRLGFQLSGSAYQGAAPLHWNVTCGVGDPPPVLSDITLPPPASRPRRLAFRFLVPSTCPAQWLRLTGVAGEFPTSVNASIDRITLQFVSSS